MCSLFLLFFLYLIVFFKAIICVQDTKTFASFLDQCLTVLHTTSVSHCNCCCMLSVYHWLPASSVDRKQRLCCVVFDGVPASSRTHAQDMRTNNCEQIIRKIRGADAQHAPRNLQRQIYARWCVRATRRDHSIVTQALKRGEMKCVKLDQYTSNLPLQTIITSVSSQQKPSAEFLLANENVEVSKAWSWSVCPSRRIASIASA